MFTDEEVAYLRAQRLARISTVSAAGQPDVVPVGFEFDGTYLYVGGVAPVKTRKFRNVQAGNTKVALAQIRPPHPDTLPSTGSERAPRGDRHRERRQGCRETCQMGPVNGLPPRTGRDPCMQRCARAASHLAAHLSPD